MTKLGEVARADAAHSATDASACPGCGASGAVGFHHLVDQPVHVGVTYADAEAARRAPVGDIDLRFCGGCGLVFNAAFDPAKLDYTPGYDTSLAASPLFLRFLDTIIDRLVQRYAMSGKTVLEVGCGAGHFLRRFCERAGCDGIGIDPAVPEEGVESVGKHTIRWVRGMYGPEHAGLSCDLVCGMDMFEHVPEPGVFLRSIRRALPSAGGTPVFFESPDRGHVFDAGAGWSVYYEQCAHYDVPTMRGLFERSGFEVTKAALCEVNAQCLGVEAVTKPAGTLAETQVDREPMGLPASLAAFDVAQRQRLASWGRRLSGWADSGQDIVLWGSGGKGINFLNNVPGARHIRRVVDINPTRQGRYLPRAGQRVVAPAALVDSPPSVVVVSNPLWRDEIAQALTEFGLECELIDA
ncbi:MAG: class I SAM-dependent methyltransferase [Planctomycetota bacterium]